MVVSSGVEYLEVEPIAGILQEAAIRVGKNTCPLFEAVVDDIWAVIHLFKLPFPQLIIGFVVNKDQIAFAKGVRVDMEVKMRLRPIFSCFNCLEGSVTVLIGIFK